MSWPLKEGELFHLPCRHGGSLSLKVTVRHGETDRKTMTLLLRRLPERDRMEVEQDLRTLNLKDVVL